MYNYRLLFLCLCFLFSIQVYAGSNDNKVKQSKKKGWAASEYSGRRSDKDVRTVVLSKSFSWLSGSPADNEILSIGKSAQFFGFVSLRYESGRAAKRGSIGRAFYQITTPEQREIMLQAVREQAAPQAQWWSVRSDIMEHFESLLYTGQALDEAALETLAAQYGWLNAEVGLKESQAIAKLERTLTDAQWETLRAIRKTPDLANQMAASDKSIQDLESLSEDEKAHYEDLFAKAFSWITGTFKHRKVIPRGQPAQFFGFVAIRHKSGHGASRGEIAKRFEKILNHKQHGYIEQVVVGLKPWVKKYLATRTELLHEMELLRSEENQFDIKRYKELAVKLGMLEIICASIEATHYEKIERSMSESQKQKMMALRADYILDATQMASVSLEERGKTIMNLCSSCHNKGAGIAPNIDKLLDKHIASENYKYSDAMQKYAADKGIWTTENLDAFLASPQQTVPGTIMTFKGLTNPEDRRALIHYLQDTQ